MSFRQEDIITRLRKFAPGLVIAFTIAAAVRFMAAHYGAPVMLFALLIGMAFNFLSEDERCRTGIQFASKPLLKIGIALLGVRVTIDQISGLGWGPIMMVIGLILTTIISGVLLSRLFSKSVQFGLLTGGAVAICGASAALALSSVLPKSKELERDTLFTVAAVTALSTIAMIMYPIFFQALGFKDEHIGILIGTTIHDVAQVIGAGFAVSDETGEIATYVKLLRVACLPVVVIAYAVMMRSNHAGGAKSTFPWFAIGFVVILAANSLGVVPESIAAVMRVVSQWLLIAAIAALGVKTSLKSMMALGPSHIGLVVAETLVLCSLATLAIFFIQG